MLSKLFTNIGYVLLLLNCILFLKDFSKNKIPFKILTLYSLVMFVIQITAAIFVKLHSNNLFLSHFYFILQFVLLSLFYFHLLKEAFQKRIIVVCLVLCLAVLFVQYSIDWSHFNRFNLLEIFITSLPLIVYATFHLYNLLNEKKEFYYINIGLLIYLFGSTIVFLTCNLLISLDSRTPFRYIFDLNVYLYVVYQLFILYELRRVDLIKTVEKNE